MSQAEGNGRQDWVPGAGLSAGPPVSQVRRRRRIVGIASGKGGTGKTTVSVNLAKVRGFGIQLLDCDVEEPNTHLFLRGPVTGTAPVTVSVPQVDPLRCDGCGKCGKFCQYGAIVCFGSTPLIFPEMCHGCGGCTKVCSRRAIHEVDRRIGVVETRQVGGISLVQGRLDIGVPMAPPVIRAVKARLQRGGPVILDAPPGTSCPVVTTLRDSDFVLLVTEPTPFGLHDLRLAVEMVRVLDIPCGVVINRVGIGDRRVHEYCAANDLPILQEIPDDRRIAEVCSRGLLIVDELQEYRMLFESLADALWQRPGRGGFAQAWKPPRFSDDPAPAHGAAQTPRQAFSSCFRNPES